MLKVRGKLRDPCIYSHGLIFMWLCSNLCSSSVKSLQLPWVEWIEFCISSSHPSFFFAAVCMHVVSPLVRDVTGTSVCACVCMYVCAVFQDQMSFCLTKNKLLTSTLIVSLQITSNTQLTSVNDGDLEGQKNGTQPKHNQQENHLHQVWLCVEIRSFPCQKEVLQKLFIQGFLLKAYLLWSPFLLKLEPLELDFYVWCWIQCPLS